MATNVPDPLQQIMELMTGLMGADLSIECWDDVSGEQLDPKGVIAARIEEMIDSRSTMFTRKSRWRNL